MLPTPYPLNSQLSGITSRHVMTRVSGQSVTLVSLGGTSCEWTSVRRCDITFVDSEQSSVKSSVRPIGSRFSTANETPCARAHHANSTQFHEIRMRRRTELMRGNARVWCCIVVIAERAKPVQIYRYFMSKHKMN